MAALYLFSLILGGGFLLLSVLGGDSEADVDFDAGLDLGDGGLDLDGLAGDAGDGIESIGDAADSGQDAASRIFSIRTVVYALFGFGATGTILTRLGISMPTTLAFSLVAGAAAGFLVSMVFHFLVRTDSGAHPGDEALLGLTGDVTLPIGLGRPGTVAVERGGRRLSLRALPHATAHGDPESWKRVIVVEIDGSIARVAPLEAGEIEALGSGE